MDEKTTPFYSIDNMHELEQRAEDARLGKNMHGHDLIDISDVPLILDETDEYAESNTERMSHEDIFGGNIAREDLVRIYQQIDYYNGRYAVLTRDIDFTNYGIHYHFIKGTLVFVYCTLENTRTSDTKSNPFQKTLHHISIRAMHDGQLVREFVWTNDRPIERSFDAHMNCMKGLEFINETFMSNAETELIGRRLDKYWDSEEGVIHNEIITEDRTVDKGNRTVESFVERFERKYERRRLSPIFKLIALLLVAFMLPMTSFAVNLSEIPDGIKLGIKGTLTIGMFIMSIYLVIHYILKKPEVSSDNLLRKEWRKAQEMLNKGLYEDI